MFAYISLLALLPLFHPSTSRKRKDEKYARNQQLVYLSDLAHLQLSEDGIFVCVLEDCERL